jgi:hypothetical protein
MPECVGGLWPGGDKQDNRILKRSCLFLPGAGQKFGGMPVSGVLGLEEGSKGYIVSLLSTQSDKVHFRGGGSDLAKGLLAFFSNFLLEWCFGESTAMSTSVCSPR